eukprot:gene22514-27003_t
MGANHGCACTANVQVRRLPVEVGSNTRSSAKRLNPGSDADSTAAKAPARTVRVVPTQNGLSEVQSAPVIPCAHDVSAPSEVNVCHKLSHVASDSIR